MELYKDNIAYFHEQKKVIGIAPAQNAVVSAGNFIEQF